MQYVYIRYGLIYFIQSRVCITTYGGEQVACNSMGGCGDFSLQHPLHSSLT